MHPVWPDQDRAKKETLAVLLMNLCMGWESGPACGGNTARFLGPIVHTDGSHTTDIQNAIPEGGFLHDAYDERSVGA